MAIGRLTFAVPVLAIMWITSATADAKPPDVFVAPGGQPAGLGTRESPLDLKTAFTEGRRVPPGTTVWLAGGRYEVGDLDQGEGVHGTADAPVIFRAARRERATVVGGLRVRGDHTWLWGLEITGPSDGGVNLRGGNGVKIINMIIHDAGPAEKPRERKPSGQGIGGWDVGDDHEYYGNLIYHNGWSTLDHGIYTQNTAAHTVKRIADNIIFENAGFGIHAYGQTPVLSGYVLEGNICFAASLSPRSPDSGQCNILVGGSKPLSNVLLKSNATWSPDGQSKRSVDVGYSAEGNSAIRIEDNYFMGGAMALELKSIRDAEVCGNTFWAPAGMVRTTLAPNADKARCVFERNTFIDNGRFDLSAWQKETGAAATNQLGPSKEGRPTGLHVLVRVNRYEPERVHLAVYNWDRKDSVRIDLKGVLAAGDAYRVVSVLDYFGPPVAQGKAEGSYVKLPMKGHRYEPEFGAYVLFRGNGKP